MINDRSLRIRKFASHIEIIAWWPFAPLERPNRLTSLICGIQNFIDRCFYRRKYDAGQALQAFAETARNETDLEALTSKLLVVVEETVQPHLVPLWLRKKQGG